MDALVEEVRLLRESVENIQKILRHEIKEMNISMKGFGAAAEEIMSILKKGLEVHLADREDERSEKKIETSTDLSLGVPDSAEVLPVEEITPEDPPVDEETDNTIDENGGRVYICFGCRARKWSDKKITECEVCHAGVKEETPATLKELGLRPTSDGGEGVNSGKGND